MKKEKKLLIDKFNKQIDLIYDTIKDSSKLWGVDYASLLIIESVINISKVDQEKLKDKNAALFAEKYNKVLDSLELTCKTTAEKMGTKYVPFSFLAGAIRELKQGFEKGILTNKNV